MFLVFIDSHDENLIVTKSSLDLIMCVASFDFKVISHRRCRQEIDAERSAISCCPIRYRHVAAMPAKAPMAAIVSM